MIAKKNIIKIFILFYFTFVFVDIDSSVTNINLPLDTIEALAWGSNLVGVSTNILHLVLSQLKYSILFLEQMTGHIIF